MNQRPFLRGDRNQCQSCMALFNSTRAFSKHRIGEFGIDRRCMTEEQMTEAGMALKPDGFWVASQMSAADKERRFRAGHFSDFQE